MAVYVIVLVVIALLLIAAYRSLGGSAPPAVHSGALLLSAHVQLTSTLQELTSWADSHPRQGPDADIVRAAQRRAAGAQHALEQLPPAAELDAADQAARELLAAAAEDAAWAWRMVQADGASTGLYAAVIALRDHAAECCATAAELLQVATAGEPPYGS